MLTAGISKIANNMEANIFVPGDKRSSNIGAKIENHHKNLTSPVFRLLMRLHFRYLVADVVPYFGKLFLRAELNKFQVLVYNGSMAGRQVEQISGSDRFFCPVVVYYLDLAFYYIPPVRAMATVMCQTL